MWHIDILLGCGTQRCAMWFLVKYLLCCQARIAVGHKFALYKTRYDLQVHWTSHDKKLTWYNFGINIKLLTIVSSIVASKTLDRIGDVLCLLHSNVKVKNKALANNYIIITCVSRKKQQHINISWMETCFPLVLVNSLINLIFFQFKEV